MEDTSLVSRSRITALEEENSRLLHTNQELKEICCFVDDERQKTRRLAAEWQEFGKYTALFYKGDVEVEPSPPSERPASKGLPLHVLCALELNEQLDAGVPRFRGATNVIALNDKRLPWQGQLQRLRGSDPEQCIEQLEQRIERLESEKLELSKSLSAAHLLGALPAQQKGEEMQGRTPANTQSDNGHRMSDHSPSINSNSVLAAAVTQEICYLEEEKTGGSTRSPETIMCAVDTSCLRLDATEVELSADIQEEAENAMLRLLLDLLDSSSHRSDHAGILALVVKYGSIFFLYRTIAHNKDDSENKEEQEIEPHGSLA
eukprot:Em0019g271a